MNAVGPNTMDDAAVRAAQALLQQAQTSAAKVRWRVSGLALVLSLALMVVGYMLMQIGFDANTGALTTLGVVGTILAFSATPLIGVVVRPSDSTAIRVVSGAGAIVCISVAVLNAVAALDYWQTADYCVAADNYTTMHDEPFDPDQASALCATILFGTAVPGCLCYLAAGVGFLSTLQWSRRPHPRFLLAPYTALARLWVIVRVLLVCASAISLIGILADLVTGYRQLDGSAASELCVPPVMLLISATTRPAFRRWLSAWLGQLSLDGSVRAAAVVAAMVGGVGTDKALVLARKSFLGLPLDSLRADDLSSNEDTQLNARVVPRHLGDVDAFMSHSWRDSGRHKMAVLSAWGAEFQASHGRSPLIWLECAEATPRRGLCPPGGHRGAAVPR